MHEPVSPVCAHHPGEVRMKLQSLHSDATQPDRLAGLFSCPECGDERRLPLTDGDLAKAQAEVA